MLRPIANEYRERREREIFHREGSECFSNRYFIFIAITILPSQWTYVLFFMMCDYNRL